MKKRMISISAVALLSAASAFAANGDLNGVWTLDSGVCKGEGKAVDELNADLKRIIPSDLRQIFIVDGSTASFMSNDPQPNDPCVILVQGTVSSSESEVILTPKYPVSIGASRCKIDNTAAVKFKKNGNILELSGSDNKGVCKEIVYSYSKMTK